MPEECHLQQTKEHDETGLKIMQCSFPLPPGPSLTTARPRGRQFTCPNFHCTHPAKVTPFPFPSMFKSFFYPLPYFYNVIPACLTLKGKLFILLLTSSPHFLLSPFHLLVSVTFLSHLHLVSSFVPGHFMAIYSFLTGTAKGRLRMFIKKTVKLKKCITFMEGNELFRSSSRK